MHGAAIALAALLPWVAAPAAAQSAGLALVIGNAAYTATPNLPPLPGCGTAAREVSAALRDLGFTVTERLDTGRGELDAAIAGFGRALREAPGAAAVIYLCGHLASQGTRLFLLPVSAALQRETDVLTQGVLARVALDAMTRARVGAGLLVLEGGTPAQAEALVALAVPLAAEPVGLAASQLPAGPLAAALVEELRGPRVELGALLAGLRRRLPDGAYAALATPARPLDLAGAPPATPIQPSAAIAAPTLPPQAVLAPAVQAAPAAIQAPASVPHARPPATATPSPAVAAAEPPPLLIEERAMTEADRRRVQQALARMGYYAGQADGAFGANTRAAIRRYQFELGAELTGMLTPAQAGRLLSLR